MTTATLTVSRSQYTTAPHHAHFSGKDSVPTTGTLRTAQYEWWVQDLLAETTVVSSFASPEFGFATGTPGFYRVTFRIRGQGDGAWTEDSANFTVLTPTYSAECWVDMDAGSDGVGSLADPFNTLVSAISYIDTNWVAGATNEHCIHLKRGTSQTLAAGVGTKTAQGRLVIRDYGSGALPVLHLNALDLQLIRSNDNHSLCLWNIDVDGGSTYPHTPGVNSTIQSDSNQSNTPAGHNLLLIGCTFRNLRGQINVTSQNADATFRDAGYGDFVALANCTFSENNSAVLLQSSGTAGGVRYYLDTSSLGRASLAFHTRATNMQHAYVRVTQTGQHDANVVPYRMHSSTDIAGVDTEWVCFDCCTWLGAPWLMPDDGNLGAQDIKNLWIVRCKFQAATGSSKCLDVFANDGLVVRNNTFRMVPTSTASCVGYRLAATNATTSVNWLIENNTFVHPTASGFNARLAWNFHGNVGDSQTGITFRNNLLVAPSVASGTNYFFGNQNVTADPAVMFDACDGNQFAQAAGTAAWASNFSVGSGTLATWKGATTFDDASSVGTANPLTDALGATLDATLVAASAPIDAGIAVDVYVDHAGHIRTGSMDVGALSFGDATEPTAPTVDVAAVDPTDSVFIAARMRTING